MIKQVLVRDDVTKTKWYSQYDSLEDRQMEFDKILTWLEARLAEVKPPKPDHSQFEHNDWSDDKVL